ncbi:MAG TPA: Fur family transcriptional regulator [Actinomycetota bacterium]|nr:Fur family transcriptional regulator [Actinomycetota bacterium]
MDSVDDVVRRLRALGHRLTPQRQVIIREVLGAEGHITPQDLARRVQRRMPAVNVSTVYRALATLESLGVVSHSHEERGARYHRAGEGDHVHLTCSSCGAEDDLSLREAERLRDLIEKHRGFTPDLAHFAISGLCSSCASRRRRRGGRTPARTRRARRGPG